MLYHGVSKSAEYASYYAMKSRCLNEKNKQYRHYGGRGIKVCDRWLEKPNGLLNFLNDMGPRPKGKSLDRINNNEGYFPGNCRWATSRQQCNNKRNNVKVEYEGVFYNVCQLIEKFNITRKTVTERVWRGWSLVDACTKPCSPPKNTSGCVGVYFSKSQKAWIGRSPGRSKRQVCSSVNKEKCIEKYLKWKEENISNQLNSNHTETSKPDNYN